MSIENQIPSIPFLLLFDVEQKFFVELGNTLIELLKNNRDGFSQVEIDYWIDRINQISNMAQADIDVMKSGAALVQRQQAVNALVPFVNKAYLN